MTTLASADYRLTNGDLADMDLGELREHLTRYVHRNLLVAPHWGNPDEYAQSILRYLAAELDSTVSVVWEEIGADLLSARVGAVTTVTVTATDGTSATWTVPADRLGPATVTNRLVSILGEADK